MTVAVDEILESQLRVITPGRRTPFPVIALRASLFRDFDEDVDRGQVKPLFAGAPQPHLQLAILIAWKVRREQSDIVKDLTAAGEVRGDQAVVSVVAIEPPWLGPILQRKRTGVRGIQP